MDPAVRPEMPRSGLGLPATPGAGGLRPKILLTIDLTPQFLAADDATKSLSSHVAVSDITFIRALGGGLLALGIFNRIEILNSHGEKQLAIYASDVRDAATSSYMSVSSVPLDIARQSTGRLVVATSTGYYLVTHPALLLLSGAVSASSAATAAHTTAAAAATTTTTTTTTTAAAAAAASSSPHDSWAAATPVPPARPSSAGELTITKFASIVSYTSRDCLLVVNSDCIYVRSLHYRRRDSPTAQVRGYSPDGALMSCTRSLPSRRLWTVDARGVMYYCTHAGEFWRLDLASATNREPERVDWPEQQPFRWRASLHGGLLVDSRGRLVLLSRFKQVVEFVLVE